MLPSDFPEPIAAPDLHNFIDAGGESVWGPYIRKGHRTLFSAHPKIGKTTLVSHVLCAMATGGYLAGEIIKGTALVVSEESNRLWAQRTQKLGIGNNVKVVGKNVLHEWGWSDLCFGIAWHLENVHLYDLVVIDTFPAFARLEDENSSAECTEAMSNLQPIMSQNAAILLIHHCRKSGGRHGLGVRGSTALTGSADILLQMDYPTKADKNEEIGGCGPRHRKLTMDSRFDDISPTIIELAKDGRTYMETSRVQIIARLLPEGPPGLLPAEVLAKWPSGYDRPTSAASLATSLGGGERNYHLWEHTGGSKKGDPNRYYRVRI